MTVLNSWLFGLDKQKQMHFDVYVDEWKENRGSVVLNLAPNSNCHGCSSTSTAAISSRFLHSLPQQNFNDTCRWWIKHEQSKGNGEIRWKSEKKFEQIWENLRDFCLDLREWIVNVNSVTIKNIYDVLINLVKHD